MLAVTHDEAGRIFVEEVPAIGTLAPGFVRVRVTHTMISPGTETGNLRGLRAKPDPKPRRSVHGYTAAGVAVEVNGAEHVAVGDRVACYGGPYTRHSAELAVPRHLVYRVPERVSQPAASSVGLGAIALHAFRRADAGLGCVVAVQGLGILGNLISQNAAAAGCEGLALDLLPGRLALARQMLPAHWRVLDAAQDDVAAAVADLSYGAGVDAVIAAVAGGAAASEATRQAAAWLRMKGTLVIVGRADLNANHGPLREKEIEPRYVIAGGPGRYDSRYERDGQDYPIGYARWTEGRNMRAYLRLLELGAVRVEPLITHTFPVERAAEAFDRIIDRPDETVGVVLDWQAAG
jgi:NADPH2:quinone reductase